MQIETTMSNHLTPKNERQRGGDPCTISGDMKRQTHQVLKRTQRGGPLRHEWNVNWHSHYREQYRGSSKKLKTETTMWFNILLLSIYPKEMKSLSWRDICILMFTAAIFTIAKTRKRPKCPVMNEWIKKMWCTHTHINIIHKKILISHKKGGNSATYNNTAESLGHYAKSNKSDRERQIWYDFNYMWNIKQLNS